jgi:hypothetical protein
MVVVAYQSVHRAPAMSVARPVIWNLPMFSSQHTKLTFPVWQFLSQPVFDSKFQVVLNPRRFWRFHQVSLLERCLSKECASKDSRCD